MRKKSEVHHDGNEKPQGSLSRWKNRKDRNNQKSSSTKGKRFFSNFFKSRTHSATAEKEEKIYEQQEIILVPIENEPAKSPVYEKEREKGKEKESLKQDMLSVRLNSLVKGIEEWRRTLVYEENMEESNNGKINKLTKFPWHTSQSILTLHGLLWIVPQLTQQKEQIKLLRFICDELLEPVFQQYIDKIQSEVEEEQARQLCNYLRKCIEKVMSTTMFEGYPSLLNPSFNEFSDAFLTKSILFRKEDLEIRFRSQLQVQPLRFTQASAFYPPFDRILPFICSELNIKEYEGYLNMLAEKTTLSATLQHQNQLKISELASDLEHSKAPKNYVSLASFLPSNKVFRKAFFLKLAEHLSPNLNSNYPKFTSDEHDIFIRANSLLAKSLQQKIEIFNQEHKKLKLTMETSPDSNFLKAMSTKLAGLLAADLMDEQFIEPIPRPISNRFLI